MEIGSESSLAEAVRVLAKHKLLSAPVVDAEAPEDASWVERYIGIVEFAGIVVWILQQVSNHFIHTEAPSESSCGHPIQTRTSDLWVYF